MTKPYSNFTEETCTGTGATMALAGATTGNIVFSESFADGDEVNYIIEDSNGVNKVSGVGTYVSATDDITRNDTWSWNGTVIDDDPTQSNITLSGGTHTIHCDVIDKEFNTGGVTSGRIYNSSLFHEMGATLNLSATQRIAYIPMPLDYSGFYDGFSFEVTTSGGNVRLGLYTSKDGLPDILLAVHDTTFSVGTTGLKVASFDGGSLYIPRGHYFLSIHNDGTVIVRANQGDSVGNNQLGKSTIVTQIAMAFKSRTYGVMPNPADITSLSYQNQAAGIGVNAT